MDIYGTQIKIPQQPKNEDIYGWDKPILTQKWVREELPSYFQKAEIDKEGNLFLTKEQKDYADLQIDRCRNGFWIFIRGVATWIPPKYYFYLQWWKLEDDIYADYREADRKYFLYLNHWENIKWCLGVIRGKHRRAGASSQSCANLIYECVFFLNSNCGLISKTNIDSRDTFTDMVRNGYQKLPIFLKPKQLNKADSVTELVFAQKTATTKEGDVNVIDNNKGNQSRVSYRAPVLNAYDRGRLSRVLLDEFGKLEEVSASQLFSIISETLVKGIKRVGFCEMPSTVNELTKHGGAEYKVLWDNAKAKKKNQNVTVNRLVTYFNPAFDGLEGFIDEYGQSVIEDPTKEQYDYLVKKWVKYDEDGSLISEVSEDDVRLGAKKYLVTTREGLTGNLLEEQIRKYPFDEDEMFMYAGTGCEFNSINIKKQIKELEENPVYLRKVRLVKNEVIIKSPIPKVKDRLVESISYMDSESGGWYILEEPKKPNNFKKIGDYYEPLSKLDYQIGVDTTKDDFAIDGSKPTICVFKKSCIIDGEETGLYPVALYLDRARLDIHFDEEVLKACMWYGCTANYEIDAGTQFYRYFAKLNANYFLEWTPKFAQDPVKMKPLKPGSQSADPFQLAAQLQVAKMYIDGTSNEGYNGHVHRIKFPTLLKQLLKYDHAKRTPYDQVISLMMCLLCVIGDSQLLKTTMVSKPKNLLPKYNLKLN